MMVWRTTIFGAIFGIHLLFQYAHADNPLTYDFSSADREIEIVKEQYDGNVWVLSGAQKLSNERPSVTAIYVYLTLEACNNGLYEILNYLGDDTGRSLEFSKQHQSLEVVVQDSGYVASYICSKQPVRSR